MKHLYTLVCDDVRREQSGKLIVIGMYTAGVVLQRIPANLPGLTFLTALQPTAAGKWEFTFRLSHVATGAVLGPEGKIEIEVPKVGGPAVIPIRIGPLNFQMPGEYAFTLGGPNFDGAAHLFEVSQRPVTRVH